MTLLSLWIKLDVTLKHAATNGISSARRAKSPGSTSTAAIG